MVVSNIYFEDLLSKISNLQNLATNLNLIVPVYVSVATGSTYSGSFENDLRHGFGILMHPLGKYCGDFVADAKHGIGTLILDDTSSYYGQFENNLFHGRGTYCYKDGTVYVGDWMEGLKCGDGYETLPDGR